MGYLEGLLGGFTARKGEYEKEQIRQQDLANAREGKVFESLLSSTDPEVQSLAMTGLLTSAQPSLRKSGLRGWLGEMAQNPITAQMQKLIGTPVQTEEPVMGVPSRSTTGYIGTPPGQTGSLAQSETAATEPGAPPLTAPQPEPTAALQTTEQPAPVMGTQTITKPRQLFMSPEEVASMPYRGRFIGLRSEMEKSMGRPLTPDEAKQLGLELSGYSGTGTSGGGYQSVPGELPDGSPAFGVFDRAQRAYVYPTGHPQAGQPILGFQPRTATGSTSLGADREATSRRLYGVPAAQVASKYGAAAAAHVEAEVLRQKGQLTSNQALSAAARMLPEGTIQQQTQLADALMAGTAAPVMTQSGGAPGTSVGVPPTPGVSGAVGVPPAAGAAGTGIGSQIPPELGASTRETGKPLPTSVQAALSKAESTNDLISQALTALEPFKNDNTLQGSIRLASKYRQGIFDPVATIAAQLSDLAGLQSSAQAQLTGGSSRAIRYYVDRRQHVPRLPSGRQIDAASLVGSKATSHISQWVHGDEGGFDSPMLMYQKLLGAQANNKLFIDATRGGAMETKPPVPAVSHPSTVTPSGYQHDAAGNIYKDGVLVAPAGPGGQ